MGHDAEAHAYRRPLARTNAKSNLRSANLQKSCAPEEILIIFQYSFIVIGNNWPVNLEFNIEIYC